MKRGFTILSAFAALFSAQKTMAAPKQGKDTKDSHPAPTTRTIMLRSAHGDPMWMPTRSQRVKNKVRTRQKQS